MSSEEPSGCEICGGPLGADETIPYRHRYASGCIKALAAVVGGLELRLTAQQDLLEKHGEFMSAEHQHWEAQQARLKLGVESFLALRRTAGEHTKSINELSSKLTVHEARHNQPPEPELPEWVSAAAHSQEVLQAKQEGYNRGSDDTRRRFVKYFKEAIGDD